MSRKLVHILGMLLIGTMITTSSCGPSEPTNNQPPQPPLAPPVSATVVADLGHESNGDTTNSVNPPDGGNGGTAAPKMKSLSVPSQGKKDSTTTPSMCSGMGICAVGAAVPSGHGTNVTFSYPAGDNDHIMISYDRNLYYHQPLQDKNQNSPASELTYTFDGPFNFPQNGSTDPLSALNLGGKRIPSGQSGIVSFGPNTTNNGITTDIVNITMPIANQ